MLRHLRMTPTAKEIPKSEGRILSMLHDWIQPFYRYRIPHSPTPRDRVCTCAYPLFTLRSSHRSPYDEPTLVAAMHETVYVDSSGKTTSPPVSEMHTSFSSLAAAPTSPSSAEAPSMGTAATSTSTNSEQAADAAASSTTSTSGGTTGTSSEAHTADSHASSAPSSAFLSSFGALPSLRARWAVRRRLGGRLTTPQQSTETCYRCDICDGLQRSAGEAADTRAAGTTKTSAQTPREEADEEEEDDEEAEATTAEAGSDERYGYTTSTDIANTAMEDADVAELRHLDPFHVEVFGKPSWGTLLKRASREVNAQLSRCGLRTRETSRYAAQATANSDVSRQVYRAWVRAEAQRVREQQRKSSQQQATKNATAESAAAPAASSSSPSICGVSPLLLSPEQRAIIKYKLDTLHMAAYLARYAVAAYGLPYELNFFTSVREMTKLMAEPHSRYVCANSEEQLESMRRMLQGEEPDALLECVASRYSLRVGQPCWSLFLDHAAQRVILSFRGSMTAADLVVDVMEGYANVMLHPTEASNPTSSRVDGHDEDQRVCTAIPLGFYDSVVEAAAQLLPILRTIHAQYSAYTLCVTGHSLGGIQASVFHLLYCGPWRATLHSSSSMLRRTKTLVCPSAAEASSAATLESSSAESTTSTRVPFSKTITCTFAAAPVVEKRVVPTLNAWLDAEEARSGSRLLAISHGMDLITRLQVHSLRETFTKAYTIAGASATAAAAATDAAQKSARDGAAVTVSDKMTVPLLAIPGALYNVTAGQRRRYLLAVPPSASAVREQIILSAEAVLQHFPCLYLRSLNELLNRYEAKWGTLRTTSSANETDTLTAPEHTTMEAAEKSVK